MVMKLFDTAFNVICYVFTTNQRTANRASKLRFKVFCFVHHLIVIENIVLLTLNLRSAVQRETHCRGYSLPEFRLSDP